MRRRHRAGYSEEFNEGAWLVLRDHLAPALLRAGDATIDDLDRVFAHVRGNPMAKAALIDAFVDADLRARDESLASWLGAERDRVACGVSIGIADTTEALLEQVEGYLAEGYRRIKLKIEPGLDVERVEAVRSRAPRHRAQRRRQRRVHDRRRRRLPRARRVRAADDRAAAAPRRPGAARGVAASDRAPTSASTSRSGRRPTPPPRSSSGAVAS